MESAPKSKIVTAFQQHGCTQAYAASFSMHLCSCTRQCKVFHSEKNGSQLNKNEAVLDQGIFEKKREKYGQFHTLFSKLHLSDREYFFLYIRMSPEHFDHLLILVAPYIQKKACRSRDPISPAEH